MTRSRVRFVSLVTTTTLLTSCAHEQYRIPTPVTSAPQSPASPQSTKSSNKEQILENQGRVAWQRASSMEQQHRYSEALGEYLAAAGFFDRASAAADSDQIPLANRPPSVYLNSARSRIDVSRLLSKTHANFGIISDNLLAGERALHQLEELHSIRAGAQGQFWQPWAWRIYYLFGDLWFLQGRLDDARHAYLIASVLNPNAPQPKVMMEVIKRAESGRKSEHTQPPLKNPPSGSTTLTRPDQRDLEIAKLRAEKAEEEAAKHKAEARAFEIEAGLANAQKEGERLRSLAEIEKARAETAKARAEAEAAVAKSVANAHTPANRPTQSEVDRTTQALSNEISFGRLLQYGAAALPIAVHILGIVELGPVGIGVGILALAGMAWDDWNKPRKSSAPASR